MCSTIVGLVIDPDDLAPDAVLSRLREQRSVADAAEASILVLAARWADLHPAREGHQAAFESDTLPGVAWDAPAELDLALGMGHDAGSHLIHDALELRHRLPHTWQRITTGHVQAWRGRRIAQATLDHDDDVAAHIDDTIAPLAHRVGPVTTARLIDEAMARLHPAERELAQLQALAHRHATLHDTVSHDGVAHMDIHADLKDLLDFNDTLAAVAAALASQGSTETLDVRRSLAVGVLADPCHAAALLDPVSAPTGAAAARPRKQLVLHVHLSHDALAGLDPVGRCETGAQPLLERQIRDWCGRTDTHLRVQPVIDLTEHAQTTAYEIPDRLRTQIQLRSPTCTFPWCTRAARTCDLDHTIAHSNRSDPDGGGRTCTCNLTPLCRRHHRLKTLTGWGYTTVEPGTHLWTSPLHRSYLRDASGTRDVTPTHPPPTDGCQHRPSTSIADDTSPPAD